jgi:hypothetical protein
MGRNNGSGGTARPRKQTGLRNRNRTGTGSYARNHKDRYADKYPNYATPATMRDIEEKEVRRRDAS